MYQRVKAARNKESGFTLIELLIVIVILGILAGVVIFASAGFKNKGSAEACKTNLSSVKTAVEAFHTDSATAKYPVAWGDLATYFDANGTTFVPAAAPVLPHVQGKGWSFGMAFDNTGVNPPTYTAGIAADGVTCAP